MKGDLQMIRIRMTKKKRRRRRRRKRGGAASEARFDTVVSLKPTVGAACSPSSADTLANDPWRGVDYCGDEGDVR